MINLLELIYSYFRNMKIPPARAYWVLLQRDNIPQMVNKI